MLVIRNANTALKNLVPDAKASMIQCSGGVHCANGGWCHPECFDVPADQPDGDWWCSPTCKQFSRYCLCHLNLPDEEPHMIGCSSGAQCIGPEWFHQKCVGLLEIPGIN